MAAIKTGEIIDVNNIWFLGAGDIIQDNKGKYMVLGLHAIHDGQYHFSILEEDGTVCNMVGEPEKMANQFGPYVYVGTIANAIGKFINCFSLETVMCEPYTVG